VKDKEQNIREEELNRNTGQQEAEDDNVQPEFDSLDENALAEIETLKEQNQELKDKYLRMYAEFENYKKRTLKEKLDLMRTASADLIKALLPVLDDFDRAKKISDDGNTEETFSEGVALVYNKLYSSLKNKGLQPMESNGHAFDPELHEAVTEIPAPTDDMKGKVVDTIEKGYQLNDSIIRHAKVVVGK